MLRLPSNLACNLRWEVLIGLTVMSYRLEGMRINDTVAAVSYLKSALLRESGSFKSRPSAIQFHDWVSKARLAPMLILTFTLILMEC